MGVVRLFSSADSKIFSVGTTPSPRFAAKLVNKQTKRTAPRRWWQRVSKDLASLGYRIHQLEQCLFMLFNATGSLIGIIGVYVDDFIVAGSEFDEDWLAAKQKVIDLYKWCSWKTKQFKPRGVEYVQKKDYSINKTECQKDKEYQKECQKDC